VIKETVGEAADRPKLRAEGKDHEISGKPQKYRARAKNVSRTPFVRRAPTGAVKN